MSEFPHIRISWRWWGAAAATAAVLFCLWFGLRYNQLRADYALCESADPHHLDGPAGDTIEMDTRFCGLLAGDPGTEVIFFRSGTTGRRTLIFAYEPRTPSPGMPEPTTYPKVAWASPKRVILSIDAISQVQHRRSEADGTEFTYDIGKIDYP